MSLLFSFLKRILTTLDPSSIIMCLLSFCILLTLAFLCNEVLFAGLIPCLLAFELPLLKLGQVKRDYSHNLTACLCLILLMSIVLYAIYVTLLCFKLCFTSILTILNSCAICFVLIVLAPFLCIIEESIIDRGLDCFCVSLHGCHRLCTWDSLLGSQDCRFIMISTLRFIPVSLNELIDPQYSLLADTCLIKIDLAQGMLTPVHDQ